MAARRGLNRRSFIATGAATLTAMAMSVRAQPSGPPPRIGSLNNLNPRPQPPGTDVFLEGLRPLGWIDGKNIAIEYRWADGDMRRHAALVADLVSLPVAIIVTAGTQAVTAALQATK